MSSVRENEARPEAARPIARTLARFARNLRYDDLPEPVRRRAPWLLLDAVGIALASNRYPFAERILDGLGALGGDGAGTVIGRRERLPLRDAATANGALVHGLDFDDTHMRSIVHATAATLPAALSVAEHARATGRDLVAAYVAGVEVAIRLGLARPFGLHERGYHATGVVAHFASALVAGRLLGLDEDALSHAQGIAGSTAMASQEFAEEGAWNKRLHPGWGAIAGITAAYLARSGFRAPTRPYEGRYGVYAMHLGELAREVDYDAITAGLGERFELLACAVKPFPTCHFTHAIADAALALRARGVRAGDVERMRILVPRETLPVIAEPLASKRRPASDYEAKFSAPWVAAACLVRGRLGLRELDDDVLADADILALAARCECDADPDSEFPRFFSGGVVATTRDGVEHVHHERVNRGAGDRALGEEEIEQKFLANATLWVDEARARAIRDRVLAVADTPAAAFAAALGD